MRSEVIRADAQEFTFPATFATSLFANLPYESKSLKLGRDRPQGVAMLGRSTCVIYSPCLKYQIP